MRSLALPVVAAALVVTGCQTRAVPASVPGPALPSGATGSAPASATTSPVASTPPPAAATTGAPGAESPWTTPGADAPSRPGPHGPTGYPSVADVPSLYYVAVGDGGPLGCGDTAVAAVTLPASPTPVRDAMTALLADHAPTHGASGLTNSLAASRLAYVDGRVVAPGGLVEVYLSGTLVDNGSCDIARIRAQLEMTALSAARATTVQVFLNGEPLAQVLDQRG